jgi:serine protease
MAPRRFIVRFRVGLVCAAVAIGGVFTGGPLASQEVQVRRVQVPSIAVPRIQVPVAPGPTRPAPVPLQLPVMSRDQLMAYTEAGDRHLNYLPGQVLVKFRSGAMREGRQRALSVVPSQPDADNLEWILGDIALIKNIGPIDPEMLAQQLSGQSDVVWAEPNYLVKPQYTPADPSYASRQWNMTTINMPRAWDIAPGGSSSVIVAVVDTGITAFAATTINVSIWNGSAIVPYAMPAGVSPDFDTSRFVSPRDFTISTTNPSTIVVDTDSHGTHVAGTVGENANNGISVAGIAFNTTIMPLKACTSDWDLQLARSALGLTGFLASGFGGCNSAATSAAIKYAADNGAKVINYSIGGSSPNLTVRDALAYATSKGVFIAVSNGNDFEDGNPVHYPSSYAPDLPGVMSVAATNFLGNRAYYSSTGTYTEIAAPGGDARQGSVIWQASIRSSDSPYVSGAFPRFDRYDERGFQGTSMASPHVAGVAALLIGRQLELGRTLTPAQIETILRQTAKDMGATGKDNDFGYGLVQPFAALFGQGIIR